MQPLEPVQPKPAASWTRQQAADIALALRTEVKAQAVFAEKALLPPAENLVFRDSEDVARAVERIGQETGEEDRGLFVTVTDRAASLLQSHLEEDALETGRGVRQADGRVWVQYGGNDAGWIASVAARISADLHPPMPPSDFEIEEQPAIRKVALLSDWGTNLYGAPRCSEQIAQLAGSDDRWGLVMHLGDTYYSGRKSEIDDHLLSPWPSAPGALRRALNGNHEMYCGGGPYFDRALKAFGQESSYFALGCGDWVLVALDTAWAGFSVGWGMMKDGHLEPAQLVWLQEIERRVRMSGRKMILFSHHQPFHFSGTSDADFVRDLAFVFEGGALHAWYWGHQHFGIRCARHPEYGFFGRCVGHGGIPESRPSKVKKAPVARPIDPNFSWKALSRETTAKAIHDEPSVTLAMEVLDGPNPLVPQEAYPDKYSPNGWVELSLEGKKLFETWYLAHDGSIALDHEEVA